MMISESAANVRAMVDGSPTAVAASGRRTTETNMEEGHGAAVFALLAKDGCNIPVLTLSHDDIGPKTGKGRQDGQGKSEWRKSNDRACYHRDAATAAKAEKDRPALPNHRRYCRQPGHTVVEFESARRQHRRQALADIQPGAYDARQRAHRAKQIGSADIAAALVPQIDAGEAPQQVHEWDRA